MTDFKTPQNYFLAAIIAMNAGIAASRSAATRCTFGFPPKNSSNALAFGISANRSMPNNFLTTPHASGTLNRNYKSATLKLSPAT